MKCAVLIPSTDSFSDVWPPALECLRRYWPDCPWPIYTSSEKIPWGANPILVDCNRGWTAGVVAALNKIDDVEYVVLFLEDMLLCEPVRTDECRAALELIQADEKIGAVRLGPGPETFEPIRHTIFGKTLHSSPYRISTSPTLWRVDFLMSVLGSTTTAWEFEMSGTKIVSGQDTEIYVVAKEPRPIQVLYTSVTRGEWEEGALNWLQRIGVAVEPNRPVKGYERGQRWPKV